MQPAEPGRYRLPRSIRTTEHHDLAVATAVVPPSVACLIDLGPPIPRHRNAASGRGLDCRSAWEARSAYSAPPFRVVTVSTAVLDLGIEEDCTEGQKVRICSLARTVADCFRLRNKIELDVALEALTDAWRSERLKLDKLSRIAKKPLGQRMMQPYIETVVV